MKGIKRRLGRLPLLAPVLLLVGAAPAPDTVLKLGAKGYLTAPGLDVIVFDDIYPDGHQTGVTIIQHGSRVAANGDLRLEPEPGQWSPMPTSAGKRVIDPATGTITQSLVYPDPTKNAQGFNPIFYPDLKLNYQVRVTPAGKGFRISVDLDTPIPREQVGRVGFNLELFPTPLFGKAWTLDRSNGAVLDKQFHAGRNAGQFHWVHQAATDSKGTLYTGEVDTAKRIQRFVLDRR